LELKEFKKHTRTTLRGVQECLHKLPQLKRPDVERYLKLAVLDLQLVLNEIRALESKHGEEKKK
jgi:hypothetical protein